MREIDVQLSDMADGLGMGVGEMMRGVMTGALDERVREGDVLKNDYGEPIGFRVDERRAFSIFGDDVEDVRSDLSTIEEMPSMGEARSNGSTSAGRSSASSPSPTGGSPPAATGSKSADSTARRNGGSTLADVGKAALLMGGLTVGAYGVIHYLSKGQREGMAGARNGWNEGQIWRAGWRGFQQGVEQIPRTFTGRAAETYRAGWMAARDEARRKRLRNQRTLKLT